MAATAPPGWEHFDHGADIGIRGYGATLAEAFQQAAFAMTAAITDPKEIQETEAIEIESEGDSLEDLFFSWLQHLVLAMATRDMLFRRFFVRIDGNRLKATAWGEHFDRTRHEVGVEVKGPTYTCLRVGREPDGRWLAQCVIDV